MLTKIIELSIAVMALYYKLLESMVKVFLLKLSSLSQSVAEVKSCAGIEDVEKSVAS